MPSQLINSNQLGAGLEVPVGDNAVAWARISSMGTLVNAAFELKGAADAAGAFSPLVPTAATIPAADGGKLKGPYPVAGLHALRLEPTAVETAGAAPAPLYVMAEIVMAKAVIKLA